jgi:hypothetical protein
MTKFEQWRAGTNLTNRKAGLSVFGRTKVSHFAMFFVMQEPGYPKSLLKQKKYIAY